MKDAIDAAVEEAQATYNDAEKSPLDHAFVMVKGLDGRTSLCKELKAHPKVHVDTGGYHGTTLKINGIERYGAPQRGAYDVFIKTLLSHGIDRASGLHVWSHGH